MLHALSHDGYVGGWLDHSSGFYYFDSLQLFPEDSVEAAMDFARLNGQKAIYILSSKKEIRLDGKKEHENSDTTHCHTYRYPKAAYTAEMTGEGFYRSPSLRKFIYE